MSKNKTRTKLDQKLYDEQLTASEVSRWTWKDELATKVAVTLGVKKEEI